MKSLLLSEYNHLDIVDLPVPAMQPGEVLVKVEACGICGSDVHGYDGSSGRRIPPIVMGHEAAGTVAAVGANVENLSVGDRVTFDSTVYCGHCAFCARGDVNLCDNRQVIGVSCTDYRRAGAFAEFISIPQHIVYRLPESVSFPEAAMLEAVAVALHAVRISPVAAGETALVIGAGMIGLLTLQAALAAGCSRVLIADVDETRLNRDTHRQHHAGGHHPAPEDRKPPVTSAGIMRLRRRVPRSHRAGGQRKDQGQASDHRHRLARRGAEVV
jgi:L-iditol 2-dehydrogenase